MCVRGCVCVCVCMCVCVFFVWFGYVCASFVCANMYIIHTFIHTHTRTHTYVYTHRMGIPALKPSTLSHREEETRITRELKELIVQYRREQMKVCFD